jgi:hypothetical protein
MSTYIISFPLWVDEFGIGDRGTYTVIARSEGDAIQTFITDMKYQASLNLLKVSLN